MTTSTPVLEPSARWLPGFTSGQYTVSIGGSCVIDAASGELVGALVPSLELARSLSRLPLDLSQAEGKIKQTADLSRLSPVLQSMQVVSSIGALASVANLTISCVDFAVVLQRLSRLDGKLDQLLTGVRALQDVVRSLHLEPFALSLARLRAAGASLDRALAAEGETSRRELATRARNLFQDSRYLYLQLWQAIDPWQNPDLSIDACLELQGRYVACLIGELQGEFLLGDPGAVRHAAASGAEEVRTAMRLEPIRALRSRADAACHRGAETLSRFDLEGPRLVNNLHVADDVTEWTPGRLDGHAEEAELPGLLSMEPHEIMRAARDARGTDCYLLPPRLT